ncbi:hypothetical protein M8J76_003998 [Diaphorina citri]|nr:hypothetical protein M8J76_003998 [Diaphorina citri]
MKDLSNESINWVSYSQPNSHERRSLIPKLATIRDRIRSVSKGRGKNKNMGPLIAAGVMKLGMLKALAFKALALLVGKALLLSKLAFILTAIIGLKKLLSQPKHVTYEVVSHPHHAEHGHDSYSAGWGRSLDAQNLAYNAQKPETSCHVMENGLAVSENPAFRVSHQVETVRRVCLLDSWQLFRFIRRCVEAALNERVNQSQKLKIPRRPP